MTIMNKLVLVQLLYFSTKHLISHCTQPTPFIEKNWNAKKKYESNNINADKGNVKQDLILLKEYY